MYKKEDLYGLLYSCPYGKRVENCPFAKWNCNLFAEAVKWMKNLNKEELNTIVKYHIKCSDNR